MPQHTASSIKAARTPNAMQQSMIDRKFGMFIHFGINTFADIEWTDGTLPVETYHPSSIDTDQWVRSAKSAGMKYVIITTKHHEGFCLWPTAHTRYQVNNSPVSTDVIAELAASCQKYGLELGVYYSLWDRHWRDGVMREKLDSKLSPQQQDEYVQYMLNQLTELLSNYGPICEIWFDGSWAQPSEAWQLPRVYDHIKSLQPDCAMGTNWTIGHPEDVNRHHVYPVDQQEGYPIRFFPSDFRLADPHLPGPNDPKLFSHEGQLYYMPFETTVCMNQYWFFNTKDEELKPLDTLIELYDQCTAANNIFVLNSPPNRAGVMPELNVIRLKELGQALASFM